MIRLLNVPPVVLFIGMLSVGPISGCSCEKKPTKPAEKKAITALVDQGVPSQIKIEMFPTVGATSPRPVQLVMSRSPATCSAVRETRKNRAHVLCLPQSFEGTEDEAELQMKEGLRFLKETYPRYVSGSPLHLVTDEAWGQLGFRLMLREPRVFGHGFLAGLSSSEISSTSLYALFSGGARTLVLGEQLAVEMAPLQTMAARGGLRLVGVPGGSEQLGRAMKILEEQDPRFQVNPLAGSKARK